MGSEKPGAAASGRKLSRRQFIASGLGLVGVAALAGRIWWVNANAFDYPEVHYSMGEWVDLDGAFVTYKQEDTQGYSMCVQDAQIMTRAEYIEKYAIDPTQVETTECDDVLSVLCVTLAMKNEQNDSGSLHLYDMNLVPEWAASSMRYQMGLWATSNKNVTDSMYSISLVEDSEFVAQVPYILYGRTDEDFQQEITAKRFKFIVSNAPVRNIIDIELA